MYTFSALMALCMALAQEPKAEITQGWPFPSVSVLEVTAGEAHCAIIEGQKEVVVMYVAGGDTLEAKAKK